jgi:hypothetical protein
MLSQWLVNIQYSGSVADYVTLPEYYLWAKIAVAAGAPRGEADYIHLPKNYIWKDIYDAVSGSSAGTIDWGEKQAIGHIAAAYRGDTGNPANLATYIDWPWRYQIASIVTQTNIDTDAQAFITNSGATDKEGIDQFVKGVKNLGLWNSMVCWPLRSSQNAGTGTTAFSLGGLGTFNGTLVNGPTWGVDGINFDGTDDRIDLPAIAADTTASLFYAVAYSNANEQKPLRINEAELGAAFFVNEGIEAAGVLSPFPLVGRSTVISGLGADVWHTATGIFDNAATTFSRFYNGGSKLSNTSASLTGGAANFAYIGARQPGNSHVDGTIAVAAYLNVPMSDSQVTALHNLYRQTLGAGLGLS